MLNSTIGDKLLPTCINVVEEYVYESRVTGIHRVEMEGKPSGLIEVIVPYSKHKYVDQYIAKNERQRAENTLIDASLMAEMGSLRISGYGHSNINQSLDPDWDEDMFPIQMDNNSHQLNSTDFQKTNSFDFRLTHSYQPDKPDIIPIKVAVDIEDESQGDLKNETIGESQVEEARKKARLKRSLKIKFQVELVLSGHLGRYCIDNPPQVSRMTLTWPIATPHRLVSLRVGNRPNHPIIYNPEQGNIEWGDVPLKFRKDNNTHQLYVFSSDWICLDIKEPVEIYQLSTLLGTVMFKLDGLFSNLNVAYINETHEILEPIPIVSHTILINNFTLDLQEHLALKAYLPSQQLHFPGVILGDMRITDILMLLDDQGFELTRSGWKHKSHPDAEKSVYELKAIRAEGARELILDIRIEGSSTGTMREREIKGRAKYTTSLPTGDTTVYIRGQLKGDSKRVINVINTIQQQLKEQFRHIGTAE